MINFIKNLLVNMDNSIKYIVRKGAIFAFNIIYIATTILFVYEAFYPNPFVYDIGILVFRMGVTYMAAFLACGFAFSKIKQEMI